MGRVYLMCQAMELMKTMSFTASATCPRELNSNDKVLDLDFGYNTRPIN
jgi:hypothetical protein